MRETIREQDDLIRELREEAIKDTVTIDALTAEVEGLIVLKRCPYNYVAVIEQLKTYDCSDDCIIQQKVEQQQARISEQAKEIARLRMATDKPRVLDYVDTVLEQQAQITDLKAALERKLDGDILFKWLKKAYGLGLRQNRFSAEQSECDLPALDLSYVPAMKKELKQVLKGKEVRYE